MTPFTKESWNTYKQSVEARNIVLKECGKSSGIIMERLPNFVDYMDFCFKEEESDSEKIVEKALEEKQ